MNRFLTVIALVTLSACSVPSQTSVPPGNPSTNSSSIGALVGSAQGTNLGRSASVAVAVHSIALVGTINGKKYDGYINGSCKETDKGGIGTGCYVPAKVLLHVTKLTAGLFTGTDAKGCLVATASYHGTVQAGATIPFVWHWTGKC
jgi:hypothetical protein